MEQEKNIRRLLDDKVALYNRPAFIATDPICIPHSFTKKQDIEISALFAATLAWGNRTTIINNCRRLMAWMDNAPHQFILHHKEADRKRFLAFAHRTFNATDLLYFIEVLQEHYKQHDSLEDAFVPTKDYKYSTIEEALIHFHNYFFSLPDHPERTRKHVSTPSRGSACKRLCMYLRWMVRKDHAGVDFGIWEKIKPAQLVCPLDVHVGRVAFRMGLLGRAVVNWKSALELTAHLKRWRPDDPAVYDFGLFGMGVEERWV